MTVARTFLFIQSVLFLFYGIMCAIYPEVPASYFGVELKKSVTTIEIISMYGGLQTVVGLLYLYCAINLRRTIDGLKIAMVIFAGVGLGRLAGILMYGIDNYNLFAVIFEITSLVITAIILLRVSTKRS